MIAKLHTPQYLEIFNFITKKVKQKIYHSGWNFQF
jgi:hypothetical protein